MPVSIEEMRAAFWAAKRQGGVSERQRARAGAAQPLAGVRTPEAAKPQPQDEGCDPPRRVEERQR
jgi:hypothetical protein